MGIEQRNIELEAENRLLKQALDNTQNIVIIKDEEAKFVYANKALLDLYKTDIATIVGKDDGFFNPNQEQVEFYRKNCKESWTPAK